MRKIVLILLCLLFNAGTYAQSAYVSERLYLGLYAEPNASTDPVKTMPSGTQVEIMERLGDYVKLRLADGSEGWARAEFVTQQLPTKLLAVELTKERDQLRLQLEKISKQDNNETQEIKKLQQQLTIANQQIAGLNEQLKQAKTSDTSQQEQQVGQQEVIDGLKIQIQTGEQSIVELQNQLAEATQTDTKPKQMYSTSKVLWFSISIFVALGMGIFIGVRWLSARIRKRFNGLKVW